MAVQSSWILPLKAAMAIIAITASTPTSIAYSVVPWPSSKMRLQRCALHRTRVWALSASWYMSVPFS